jgi:hypothetical protein
VLPELFLSLPDEVIATAAGCQLGGASVAMLDLPSHLHAAGQAVGHVCGAMARRTRAKIVRPN